MNCGELRHLAPLYLFDELTPQQRHSCDSHLQSCPECEELLQQQRACDTRLAAVLKGDLPEHSQVARIDEYVRRHIAAAQPHGKQRWLIPGAIAASLIAGILAAYIGVKSSAVPPSYAAAARDHWAEVVEHQARHWHSAPAEIAVLAAENGLSITQVTALAPPGYWLQHAKICGIAGRPTLHLVFNNGAQQYSLYVRPDRSPQRRLRLLHRDAEDVAGFATGSFSAIVVTSGISTQCEELAHLAAARL